VPAPNRTSGCGPVSASADFEETCPLYTLSESSLAKTLVALKRLLAERREYGNRWDVRLSRSDSAVQVEDACCSIESIEKLAGGS
jgi:hypothetical protein